MLKYKGLQVLKVLRNNRGKVGLLVEYPDCSHDILYLNFKALMECVKCEETTLDK